MSEKSFTCIANDILEVLLGENPRVLKTYMAIKAHCISNTYTWVSQEILAKKTNCSISTMERSIRKLKELGLITSKSRGRNKTRIISLSVINEGSDPSKMMGVTHQKQRTEEYKENKIKRSNDNDDSIQLSNINTEVDEMGWKDNLIDMEKEVQEKTEKARSERLLKREAKKSMEVIPLDPGNDDREKTYQDVIKEYEKQHKLHRGKMTKLSNKERSMAKSWVNSDWTALECIELISYVFENYDKILLDEPWIKYISFPLIYSQRLRFRENMKKDGFIKGPERKRLYPGGWYAD